MRGSAERRCGVERHHRQQQRQGDPLHSPQIVELGDVGPALPSRLHIVPRAMSEGFRLGPAPRGTQASRLEAQAGMVIALCPAPYYTAGAKDKERAMTTDATLTTKGQTTIPKEIRDRRGLKRGDRMTFTLMTDGTVVMRVKGKSVMDLTGLLRRKSSKPVAIARLSR